MTQTVTEIDPNKLGAMVREVNRGLMTQFINADLINRASLDVRKSYILYGEDSMFRYALPELPNENQLVDLGAKTDVVHWSKGC